MEMTLENLERHWMPFTSNRDFKREPRMFVRASGMHYFDPTGRQVLDGSSGLFCSPAGHCRPEIAAAVAEQLRTLDYTPSFMRGHPGAFALADAVAALTPRGLDHVFFCNSGSEAVDTAMKIALAYHLARNEGQRSYFVARERAYHGVNIGGTALSGMVRNRDTFGALMPGVLHLRHTLLPENRLTRGMGRAGSGAGGRPAALREPRGRETHRRGVRRADRRLHRGASFRRTVISSGCARSATATGSCWYSTR